MIINLFAPPGSGKSTTASGLFYKLKNMGVNAEIPGEYAKKLTWDRRFNTLQDQIYVFGKQHHSIHMLQQDCDVIIADSPILLGLAYIDDSYPECFKDTVYWAFNKHDNLNFYLKRTKPYNPKGRNQTAEESDAKGQVIIDILEKYNVPYHTVTGDEQGLETILEIVKKVIDI